MVCYLVQAGAAVPTFVAAPVSPGSYVPQGESMTSKHLLVDSANVSEDLASKFSTEGDEHTPYVRWVRGEGLDIIGSHYVPSLYTVELRPWARRGGRGVFLNHDASRTSNDCYVCEIPAGGALEPQRQLAEEMILILEGVGSTSVWNGAGQKRSFEWGPGACFAIPLNAWAQHFNGSGLNVVRFVAVTNLPVALNLYGDPEFVFGTDRDFPERFDGRADYFEQKDDAVGLLLRTNYVADVINLELLSNKDRGAGGRAVRFSMANGSMNSHISEFPTATYKKAHRHGPGAHVILVSGTGYSLMWPEGEEPKRYEWKAGTMITPPNMWYHQHFNTGSTSARYLALKHESVSIRNAQGVPKSTISRRIGGDQIDYADESPVVRELFRTALHDLHGLQPAMDDVYEAELAKLPPMPRERVGRVG
jgi:mannose-6-phosphate isomerase-like protein (cupin superfamily)